jgi:hypothetical protein
MVKTRRKIELTGQDYMRILVRYGQPIPGGKNRFQRAALAAKRLLSRKMCNCVNDIMTNKNKGTIKKPNTRRKPSTMTKQNRESRAIAICTSSIFKKRGLSRGKFTCKKRAAVEFTKL